MIFTSYFCGAEGIGRGGGLEVRDCYGCTKAMRKLDFLDEWVMGQNINFTKLGVWSPRRPPHFLSKVAGCWETAPQKIYFFN